MGAKEETLLITLLSIIVLFAGALLIILNFDAASSLVASRLQQTPEPAAVAAATEPSPTATPQPLATAQATVAPTLTRPPIDAATATLPATDLDIIVDVATDRKPISPLIYGVSEAPLDYLENLRPAANSWGGNNSSRFNWRAGNLFNAAHDYEFRNGNYGNSDNVADRFLSESNRANASVRLSIPAVGWVAKDWWSCGFPQPDDSCGYPQGDCLNPAPSDNVDPLRTSIASTPADIRDWMQSLRDKGFGLHTVAFDNEPELWGFSHYDVHPNCTTYTEIRDKYIAYMSTVREVFGGVQLAGPTTCCWHFYWQPAGGDAAKANYGNQDWLPWFLDQMRLYEEENDQRLLDVLDIHYYHPDLYSVEEETAETRALRLRATRSLWDPTYIDESYIGEPVYLVPRMQTLIDDHYPGTLFGISEWNFGNDDEINGALALADALGIFGREGVHYAYYWRYPELNTPGFYAFKLFSNFDEAGGRFGDTSVAAQSSDPQLSAYAAIDSETQELHIMLINKSTDSDRIVGIDLENYTAAHTGEVYRYGQQSTRGITLEIVRNHPDRVVISMPAYSIAHVVLLPDQ